MTYFYSLLEILFVLIFSPLLAGVQNKIEERLESQRGPTIFQPYYDLAKLLNVAEAPKK